MRRRLEGTVNVLSKLLMTGGGRWTILKCSLVAQAAKCLPPTAGVSSSHLGHSMWIAGLQSKVFLRVSSYFP